MAREFAEIYTECGLGAMIAPRHPGVAAVTNVTWDLGTTAVSSNISCPDSCSGGKAKVAAFIYDSYDPLEKDLAVGNGEYLDGLMELINCEPESKEGFIKALRTDFKTIVAEKNYIDKSRFEKAESLYKIVYKHYNNIS